MEQHEHDQILSDGLILDEPMPCSWMVADDTDPLALSARNERLLRVVLMPEERPDDEAEGRPADLQRLEYKLDLLLELVAGLLAKGEGSPPPRRVRLGSRGAAWIEQETPLRPGARVLLRLRPDPALPGPLSLPAEVVLVTPAEGGDWIVVRFLNSTPELTEALERLVFRHHRREVARMRGAGRGN